MNIDYGDVAFRSINEIEKDPDKYLYVFNCGYINIHNAPTVFTEVNAPGYLLIYQHKGSLKVFIDDKFVKIDSGHVLVYRPRQLRKIIYESCEENERYFVYFQGYGAEYYLKQLSLFDKIIYKTGDLSFIIKKFKEIIKDFKIHNFDCDIYRTSELLSILTSVSLCCKPDNTDKNKHSAIHETASLMEQTYYNNYPISYYAKKAAQSNASFIRNFKSVYGISPKKYLNNIKLEKAKMFLSATDLSIAAIALNLGFIDAFYFCNFFKKATGIAPSTYRNVKTSNKKALK